MNTKKVVFNRIIEGVDDSWSAKEKARYIYYQLGKVISYDRTFMYGTNEAEMEAIYYRNIDVDSEEDSNVVCNSANGVLLELLSRVGVRAEKIYTPSKIKRNIKAPNVALKFYDENGDAYYTNIIGDIENCRFNCRTNYFGVLENDYKDARDVKHISSSELLEIDRKVGNIKRDYTGDLFLSLLKEEVKNANNFKKFLQSIGIDTSNMDRVAVMKEKMKYINLYIRFEDTSTGPDERNKFYQKLFRGSVFDKMEAQRLSGFEFVKRENGTPVDSISVLELDLPDCPVYYIFDNNERRYIPVPIDEIQGKLVGYKEKKNQKLIVDKMLKEDVRSINE